MQKLDAWQVEEFDQHWSQSYARIKGNLIYIDGAADKIAQTAQVSMLNLQNRNREIVKMADIESAQLECGFYDIDGSPHIFTRSPAQQVKRGITERNASFVLIQPKAGRVMKHFSSISWMRLMSAWSQQTEPKVLTKNEMVKSIENMNSGYSLGVCLSRDYSLMYLPSKKVISSIAIVGLGGIVGRVAEPEIISIRPSVRYVKESVLEAFNTKYGLLPEVINNV